MNYRQWLSVTDKESAYEYIRMWVWGGSGVVSDRRYKTGNRGGRGEFVLAGGHSLLE